MLRIQYESITSELFRVIDEVLEMDTQEGVEVYMNLISALSDYYYPQVLLKQKSHEVFEVC